jgi:hypothetical protein
MNETKMREVVEGWSDEKKDSFSYMGPVLLALYEMVMAVRNLPLDSTASNIEEMRGMYEVFESTTEERATTECNLKIVRAAIEFMKQVNAADMERKAAQGRN